MRDIVFFDLETTGVDVATDRIWEFCAVRVLSGLGGPLDEPEPLAVTPELTFRCDPGFPLSPEVEELCGVSYERDLKGLPRFSHFATEVVKYLKDADLAGYNIRNFDIPILWEELNRSKGWQMDLSGRKILDVCTAYRALNPRDLKAAYRQYTGKDLAGAHGASVDVFATLEVAREMMSPALWRVPLAQQIAGMTRDQIADWTSDDRRVDLAGKIVLDSEGVPVFGFGKHEGRPVADHLDYVRWMIGGDFPSQTKMVLKTFMENTPVQEDQRGQGRGWRR